MLITQGQGVWPGLMAIRRREASDGSVQETADGATPTQDRHAEDTLRDRHAEDTESS